MTKKTVPLTLKGATREVTITRDPSNGWYADIAILVNVTKKYHLRKATVWQTFSVSTHPIRGQTDWEVDINLNHPLVEDMAFIDN